MVKKISNGVNKIIILGSMIIVVFFVSVPYFSSAESALSVNDILSQIKQSQNVSRNADIKCDKVTDDQFEKLGDAVTNVMQPDENQHKLMDQMMGGEGSASLKAAFITMGQRYLGCGTYGNGTPMMGFGMMGGGGGYGYGMMNGNYGNYSSDMMGNWGNSAVKYGLGAGSIIVLLGILLWTIFWIVVILAALALLRWIIVQLRGGSGAGKAMDILKEKYAKGEITKEEFEAKKKDLI